MRHAFTPAQIRMLVYRAESQLEQIAGHAAQNDVASKNIARSSHMVLHETVVSLIRLFREQVPGAAGVATRIAREYARGVDSRSSAPTLACVSEIWTIVRQAREHYLSSDTDQ